VTISEQRLTPGDVTTTTKLRVAALVAISNVLGAGVLAGLGGWVLPLRALVADESAMVHRNLVTFLAYAPVAGLGAVLAAWLWLRPEREARRAASPAAVERGLRDLVLRAPARLAVVQAVPWSVGVVVFAVVNLRDGWPFATAVAVLIALAGIATVTVAHRCSELALRPEVARALVRDPPPEHRFPSVAVRSLSAWGLGTGVPFAGLVVAAVVALSYRQYVSVTSLAVTVLVLAVSGFLLGFLVTALSSASTAASVLAVKRALAHVRDGDLEQTVPVSDTTELGMLQSGFNTMVTGLRERDRVSELFGRHVGADVAQAALRGELELDGEVRVAAVLFVDLVGSTELAATVPPGDVVTHLNRFFGTVITVVDAAGGWINKFEGDAALAVFGAPGALTDPAGSALAAARQLGEALAGSHPPIRAGIGVSAGEVVAGTIGDERRYEYTVIGDPVNEAARLCSLAKEYAGGVAASGSALTLARGDRETSSWTVVDSRRLRGRPVDTTVAVPSGTLDPTTGSGAEPRHDLSPADQE
jgi:adenylate cyclase